jgi:hypothetical protein
VRVFLAAFLIAYYPMNVFDNSNAKLEIKLWNTAIALLSSFQGIVNRVTGTGTFHTVSKDESDAFLTRLVEYLDSFTAWKLPDELKIKERAKKQARQGGAWREQTVVALE